MINVYKEHSKKEEQDLEISVHWPGFQTGKEESGLQRAV